MVWEYFSAEKHGLVYVTYVDWLAGEGMYEWDGTTVLWSPAAGLFYWAHESGCSCNGPLEDATLDSLSRGGFWDLIEDLQGVLAGYADGHQKDLIAAEVVESQNEALKVWDARNERN